MSFEHNLLISVLKTTKEGIGLTKDVNVASKLPTGVCMRLLQKMQNENLLFLKGDTVEAHSEGRLKIAVKAAAMGADIQEISNNLGWQEFEEIAAVALKTNGYAVTNNVRFKHGDRRWEIDVVGCRKPLVVCIDCKHWQHAIAQSALRKIVEAQIERTRALAEALPSPKLKLECAQWEKAKFVPAVLALFPCAFKFYYEVPIVPVLSLQDFICQLPMHIDHVKVLSHSYAKL
ncbi:MAG: YraN family protein [Candidatus Bathyarchaeia archaeon]